MRIFQRQPSVILTSWATEPLPDPTKFAKRAGEGERHAQRRRHADVEAEYNAVTCVAVYLQLMSFSQKGIDRLRVYQEHAAMRCAPGEDVVLSVGFDVGECLVLVCFLVVCIFGIVIWDGWDSAGLVQGPFHQVS